jgi:hypothetical protein
MSIVFCFLLNRVHFLRDRNLTTAAISRSRAALCEILAIRALRANGESTLRLTLALTTSWSVYSGADPRFIQQAREERDDDLEDRVGNAIEMAIISNAKAFIKSSSCQKVINAIWRLVGPASSRIVLIVSFESGKCVYQAESSHTILSDVSTSGRSSSYLSDVALSRLTNEHPSTSTTHIKLHSLITTGKPDTRS